MNPITLGKRAHLSGARLCKYLYTKPHKNTLVMYSKRNLFITIKGTSNTLHWKYNLDLKPNQYGGNRGQFRYAELCKNEILSDIINIPSIYNNLYNIENIYIASHSLGAGTSICLLYDYLKHYDIEINQNIKVDIIMFGSPKSGNKDFNDYIHDKIENNVNINIHRYHNKHDVVSTYPPIYNYEHIYDSILLNTDHTDFYDFYENHSIGCYIENLKKQLHGI